jgi:sec-independent protein translocase protein TatC
MARLRRRREPGGTMPLRGHLAELRKRLVLGAAGIVVGSVAGWFFYDPLLRLLMAPLEDAAVETGGQVTLNFSTVAASFDLKIKAALFLGLFISCPWWLYQIWAFVTPGLTRKERRRSIGFVAAAVPLFAGGAFLAWWALPNAVRLLTGFTPEGAYNLIEAQSYLTFVMRLICAFGIGCVLPVFMVALDMAGLVLAATWLKGWRWAIMAAFAFSAVVSPTPDILTMVVLATPICVLYFGAVLVCHLRDRRTNRQRLTEGLPPLEQIALPWRRGVKAADGTTTSGAGASGT